jgi:DNA polymerase-3 subunit chi
MTSVQFYHLTTTPLERALPKLLEKAVAGGFKTLLVADSEEYAERLNELLWTYDAGSFLPHGSTADPNPEAQPVLISTSMEPVNSASLLVVTNGVIPDNKEAFGRIIDIFDGSNPQIVEKARARWTSYKQSNCEMAYMRQTDSGGWEKR